MPYVPVPKDLTKVKTKVAFNLTKRQLICFGGAAAVGIPAYLLTRGFLGNTGAVMVLLAAALPFFLFAMYEKNGQPLEKVLKNIYIWRFKKPRIRPYRTNNFYAVLERQNKLDKEVDMIVSEQAEKQKAQNTHSKG